MDYGKFKYAEQKKAAESRDQAKSEIKIKFRPGFDDGDYNIRVAHASAVWKTTSAR
jgi:translation initiation factor IF-3